MKGKMILAITIAILALALSIWCFIDGTYYIGVFALFICIAQVCNFFLIKKRDIDVTKNTLSLYLF